MDIRQIIDACAENIKNKGFDVTQHATTIALIATEVAEVLEHVEEPEDCGTKHFIRRLNAICFEFELHRKAIRKPECPYTDTSHVLNQEQCDKELADIVIRVFSYAGGNGRGQQLVQAIMDKIIFNAQRPPLHGKAF